MISWIEDPAGWDGNLPAVLIAVGLGSEGREAALHGFVARALDLPRGAVVIERVTGRAPILVRPSGRGLHLSMASRGPFAAMAVAASPVGVDVEIVDPASEIPWNVLHPAEAASLSSTSNQAGSFPRLWSIKEAYLKALGVGLAREPASFAVRFIDAAAAAVEDTALSEASIRACTVWRETGSVQAAISAVLIGGVARPQ